MKILGLNAFHGDSSAVLYIDGHLVAAVEEERFKRIKHWAGFPAESIRYCLESANIDLSSIDIVAINQDKYAHQWKKLVYVLKNRPELKLIYQRIRNREQRGTLRDLILGMDSHFAGKIIPVEHHLCHLSSAFHTSPFNEAVAVSVDGFGDFASGAWGMCSDLEIKIDDHVFFPHSLGIFYEALTQYLGFRNYGDEYKVMGLAPYGKPHYINEMRDIVNLDINGKYSLNLEYFRHAREKVEYKWNNCVPEIADLFTDRLINAFGNPGNADQPLTDKHKDIAASVQSMYEEALFNLLDKLYEKYQHPNLVLAGGCAMNSVANGKIYQNTQYKKVYIQAAAGDAGGALGAAIIAGINYEKFKKSNLQMRHAYWGPAFDNNQIKTVLDKNKAEIQESGCTIEYMEDDELINITAKQITDGKIIGWFQGRMEWGPRALGNRSILCDPRRKDMKEILNLKIKRRESFRPFAPSILRESVNDWFETDDDVPFMMKVFKIKEQQREKIPAVTHVDGTGRLQTVTREANAKYYALVKAFDLLTGVPMLLNTSFNENEPIVCKPEEALDCFLRTKMDILILNNYFVSRS